MSTASLFPAAPRGEDRIRVDHARVRSDWYVEPPFAVDLLLGAVAFHGPVHDPCCGGGTIPRQVLKHGATRFVTGSDLVDRGYGEGGRNFLLDAGPYTNIIHNPPYDLAEQFILHALEITEGKVAAIVNLKFLASQGRRDRLYLPHPPAEVLILSRRPSMPPGGTNIPAKGGTADYAWLVWDHCYQGPTVTRFLS